MAVPLNHTIVRSRDKAASARLMTDILGLPEAKPFGHFLEILTPPYGSESAEGAPRG